MPNQATSALETNVNELEQQEVSQQLVELLQDQIDAHDLSRMKETNRDFGI